jgi:putative ABC transport system permease protein
MNSSRWSVVPSAWLENFATDIQYAIRTLLKSPGFTLAVIGALALGIGANVAIFSVVNTVLLHPLPYPDSERIVRIGRSAINASEPMFAFWAQTNPGFEDLSAYLPISGMNLTSGERPEVVDAIKASKSYFRLFGATPILGRTFTTDDDRPGGPHVLVMSYGLWQRRFGGDAGILGKALNLGGSSYTVIGVCSPTIKPEPSADIWVPLQADVNSTNQAHILMVAGRLPPGVTLAQANAMMRVLGKRYIETHPQQLGQDEALQVTYLERQMTSDVRAALLVLLGAVGLVLLIACANIANLLLARSVGRQREIAIRSAIGASRSRIVGQLLTEALLLAIGGGALGLAFGRAGVVGLLALAPPDLPRIQELASVSALDPAVTAFTMLIAIVTGLLFGLFPALQVSRPDLVSALKESSSQAGAGLKHNRTRSLLVAAEVTIAVCLLSGAVLLIRSFVAMHRVNLGFDPRQMLTMEIAFDANLKSSESDVFGRKLVDAVERVPGVESAAFASALPLWGGMDMVFDLPGHAPLEGFKFTGDVQWRFVSAHYFDVLRIPLRSGRLFREQEPTHTVIISEAMARKYWPNSNPVGQTILIGDHLGPGFDEGPVLIVGVVGDVRERLQFAATPVMYQMPSQIPDRAFALVMNLEHSAMLVRTRSGVAPLSVAEPVKQSLATAGNVATTKVRTMDQVSLDSTARQNFNLLLLGIFAGMALLLAAIGIYGVMSYNVGQRRHEIGIRGALGASRRDILLLVLKQALRLAILGIAIGITAAFGLTRFLRAELFGVTATDPFTFVAVPAILLVIALAAAYLPALRASRVDPIAALRQE